MFKCEVMFLTKAHGSKQAFGDLFFAFVSAL